MSNNDSIDSIDSIEGQRVLVKLIGLTKYNMASVTNHDLVIGNSYAGFLYNSLEGENPDIENEECCMINGWIIHKDDYLIIARM